VITVDELINAAVQQISMSFPDRDREATINDAVQMLHIFTLLVKAFTEREELT
jgi:hypothetical protein